MKPSFTPKLLILSALLLAMLACQLGDPAASAPPATGETQSNQPGSQPPAADGQSGINLADPTQGLAALSGYRQQFTLALKGSAQGGAYEETQTIEHVVAGGDDALVVRGQTPVGGAFYLFDARMAGYHYSQTQENGSCRAEAAGTAPALDFNPAARLPAAFGLKEAGRDTLAGQPAIQYTFNETALIDNDNQVQTASGEVWLAEGSGLVLKYELSVQLDTPEFTGERSWSYLLETGQPSPAVSLPPICPPMLGDLPQLPGASEVEELPGFQRYSASVSRQAAVAFYASELPALGWQALPGSDPQTAELTLESTVLSYVQPYQQGSRVLVIQLMEQPGSLQVITQTALTRSPVQPNVSAPPAEWSEDDDAEEQPSSPPAGVGQLPADLSLFPGAQVTNQMQNFLMFSASAPAAQIAEFYTQQMESAGWTLEQEVTNANLIILIWSRGAESVVLNLAEEGASTRATLTAIAE